jgi:uncharacterized protein
MSGRRESLSADEARRVALLAQGFIGASGRRGGVEQMLNRVGAVQLDTISVLARSHELVAYARLGDVGRERVEAAYWGPESATFEYWSHAACILPRQLWPWFAKRRRRHTARDERVPESLRRTILDRLAADGPLTARELGGARRGGEWWDWSPVKRAAEDLLAMGELVCVSRRGWHRVYDLTERAIPEELRRIQPTNEECTVALIRCAANALGVATLGDIADYHRQRPQTVRRAIDAAELIPVRVSGWDEPAWAAPPALDALADGIRGRHRTTLLSPFDSLVWHRPRTARIFGFLRKLEAYVPADRREDGYFAMPVLHRGRLVARVDPKRDGRTLVARQVRFEREEVDGVAAALIEAARWIGGDSVRCERVVPERLARPLQSAVDAMSTPAPR